MKITLLSAARRGGGDRRIHAAGARAAAGRIRAGPRRRPTRIAAQRAGGLQPRIRALRGQRPGLAVHARPARPGQPNHRRVEPALAERWTQSDDGLTYTLSLRARRTFSDGEPFTSADVVFRARSLRPDVNSGLAAATEWRQAARVCRAGGAGRSPVTLPSPFAPGIPLLENLPILPRHKLEAALRSDFAKPGGGTPLSEIAGLGPFVLGEHVTGQRVVFGRNAHYWRRDASGTRCRTWIADRGWSSRTRTPRPCGWRRARST